MRKILLLLFHFGFLFAAAQSASFDSIVNEYHQKKDFNGVVLVATHGKVNYLKAVGMADRENKRKITPQSKFKVASMTKVFTAILIVKLQQDGKIDLDANIGSYIPNYKGEGKDKVTVHQLLTYSSGIENQAGPLGAEPYKNRLTLDQYIDKYCSGKLVEKPGEKSVYGNTEYILLQKIIENVSKKSYDALLDQVILDPLGMKNTGVVNSEKIKKSLVKSYTYSDTKKALQADPPFAIENYFAAGDMYSTAEDVLILNNALFGNKILNEINTNKMLAIHEKLGYTAYGLWGSDGWGTFDEKFYYRTGQIMGAKANWIHTIKTDKTIIVLSNTDTVDLYELSEKLYLKSK